MATNVNIMNWLIVPSCCRPFPALCPRPSAEAGRHLTWPRHMIRLTPCMTQLPGGRATPHSAFDPAGSHWGFFLGQGRCPLQDSGAALHCMAFPSCPVPQGLEGSENSPHLLPARGLGNSFLLSLDSSWLNPHCLAYPPLWKYRSF